MEASQLSFGAEVVFLLGKKYFFVRVLRVRTFRLRVRTFRLRKNLRTFITRPKYKPAV
jgi:hypothetical protein